MAVATVKHAVSLPSSGTLGKRPTRAGVSISIVPGRAIASRTLGRSLIAKADKANLSAAADAIKELKDLEKVQSRVEDASKSLQEAAAKLDLSQLVRYNFIAQLVLAASSWGIMFFTTHSTVAAGAKVGLGTIILMVGTLLSGYSAFLSYGYFSKVTSGGAAVLAGWERMSKFYSHITFNFIGAAAAVLALQASVGSQVMATLTSSALTAAHLSKGAAEGSNLSLQFLTQAASNTLLAHIVSILFLVLLLKKTTDAYEPLINMAEKFKAAMSA